MRRFAIALTAVALVGVAAGCGGDEDEAAVTTTPNQTEAERMDVRGEDIVEVETHDFFFRPATLVGTPGQTVTVDVKNESAAAHTFTVNEQLADEDVQPGDVGQVRITFPESGEVAFVCTYHENRGMVGKLEVSSSSGPSTTTPTTTTTSSSDY